MSQQAGSEPSIQPIEFDRIEGSPVHVGQRDRTERIREAMFDLRLAIDGCEAQLPDRLTDTVASLARHCSIFLRKMVLGDARSPRLLDAEHWHQSRLGFNRIRKVPSSRRTFALVPVAVTGGYVQATKLDEETRAPEVTHIIPFGPQRLSIVVEWPLLGMTDWLEQPTPETPWEVRPDGLFESQPGREIDCDQWLGQQLVIFDNRGITLKDIIRVTVNTEAAHSPPLERLMISEGEKDKARFRVVQDSEIHILSHIAVCGVRYSHAVVIQAAMYLYRELTRNAPLRQPEGELGIPVFCFIPDDVFSPGPVVATLRRWTGVITAGRRTIHFPQGKGSEVMVHTVASSTGGMDIGYRALQGDAAESFGPGEVSRVKQSCRFLLPHREMLPNTQHFGSPAASAISSFPLGSESAVSEAA